MSLSLRYSLHYFFSVSIYAFIFGFFPLHFKDAGFSAFQIGALSAISSGAALLAAPIILQLAHVWFAPQRLLPACSLLSVLCFVPLLVASSFYLAATFWFLHCLFKNSADALVDTHAVRYSASGALRFETVRTYGSIGFLAINFLLGMLVDRYGNSVIMPFGSVLVLLILICQQPLVSSLLPTAGKKARPHSVGLPPSKYLAPVLSLLGVTALIYGSHAVCYAYLSLYLDALGWEAKYISVAWNLGVIAEIIMFQVFGTLQRRFSLATLLRVSIVLTVLRWLILFTTQHPAIILASQLLHAFSFGACYLASIKLAHTLVPDSMRDRAQGLVMSVGGGLGSLAGRFIAGGAAAHLGSYREIQTLFIWPAIFAGIALLLMRWVTPMHPTQITGETPEAPPPL